MMRRFRCDVLRGHHRDETASGNSLNPFTLESFTERVTLREIILSRVSQRFRL